MRLAISVKYSVTRVAKLPLFVFEGGTNGFIKSQKSIRREN